MPLASRERRLDKARICATRQVADFQGNKIPASATDGSVDWIRLDSVAVEGRLMVIQKQQGMASNYDCSTCYCPAHYTALSVAPGSFGLIPTVYQDMGSTATYSGCNGSLSYYNVTNSSTWSSNDTPVIHMDSTVHYRADAASAGTANVMGSYTDCTQYDTNPDLDCPCINYQPQSASSAGNVQKPAIVKVVNSQTDTTVCLGLGCMAKLWYQAEYANGGPIDIANLKIVESVSLVSVTGPCTVQINDNGTWYTDSTGTMPSNDPDEVYMCCSQGGSCQVKVQQTFTVDGYPVEVINGQYTGSKNINTFTCNNGQGLCPTIIPTP